MFQYFKFQLLIYKYINNSFILPLLHSTDNYYINLHKIN